MNNEDLLTIAAQVSKNAYAPFSGFCVGAALLASSGRVYTGCNVENASFPAGICAERNAFFKALSEGERSFERIAVIGVRSGSIKDFCYPCGMCRQVMAEHCDGGFTVVLMNSVGNIKELPLAKLLPYAFEV